MPCCSGSLGIAIKPKAEETPCAATMLLFHILQNSYLNKIYIYLEDLLQYIILGGGK
jgi:hypothetical protein